jgi:hypothetical protein
MKKLLLAVVCMGLVMPGYSVPAAPPQEESLDNSIDTTFCLGLVKAWKTRQDQIFLRIYAVIPLISEEFEPQAAFEYAQSIHDNQNQFFGMAVKLLMTPPDLRDNDWNGQFNRNILTIFGTVLQQSAESLSSVLEYRALVSQQVNGLEKMLASEEISGLDFCKNCWVTYLDTKLEAIQQFINRNLERLSDDEKSQFEQFKEAIAALEAQDSQQEGL